MNTVWLLTIVWVCHLSNAADCVGVYGPYPTLEICKTTMPRDAPGPSIGTAIIGRACKPLQIEKPPP
jgi:hypothetical protein